MAIKRNIMLTLLREAQRRQSAMVKLLGEFVRCESPSHEKRAVDRFGRIVATQWKRRCTQVDVIAQRTHGNHLRVEWNTEASKKDGQILVLGHLDTVYPMGTIAKMPYRIANGRAWGPGTFDMKGGLVLALAAVDVLQATQAGTRKRVIFLWTSDEEIGSESSRRMIESEARKSDAVLVLEPSFGTDGRLKTQRKGVGDAEIIVTGKSAHAGIEPEKGVNAVHELALQIERLIKMNDLKRGITVQATVVRGGTTTNVVPDEARAFVDLRFSKSEDSARIQRKLRNLHPILKGVRVKLRIGSMQPSLERSAGVRGLFQVAQSLMRDMGYPLGEAATGGGSDGNFTAALGVPTLDGLGTVGGGAHSPEEHIVIQKLPVRAALIAGLLASL